MALGAQRELRSVGERHRVALASRRRVLAPSGVARGQVAAQHLQPIAKRESPADNGRRRHSRPPAVERPPTQRRPRGAHRWAAEPQHARISRTSGARSRSSRAVSAACIASMGWSAACRSSRARERPPGHRPSRVAAGPPRSRPRRQRAPPGCTPRSRSHGAAGRSDQPREHAYVMPSRRRCRATLTLHRNVLYGRHTRRITWSARTIRLSTVFTGISRTAAISTYVSPCCHRSKNACQCCPTTRPARVRAPPSAPRADLRGVPERHAVGWRIVVVNRRLAQQSIGHARPRPPFLETRKRFVPNRRVEIPTHGLATFPRRGPPPQVHEHVLHRVRRIVRRAQIEARERRQGSRVRPEHGVERRLVAAANLLDPPRFVGHQRRKRRPLELPGRHLLAFAFHAVPTTRHMW